MDMVGTPYEPAKLWALTPDGQSNYVVEQAYDAAARDGFDGLQNCTLGQSDHQAFFDVGIPVLAVHLARLPKPVAPATASRSERQLRHRAAVPPARTTAWTTSASRACRSPSTSSAAR